MESLLIVGITYISLIMYIFNAIYAFCGQMERYSYFCMIRKLDELFFYIWSILRNVSKDFH